MADGLPKNLFTAGAVQFNSQPQTNFLIQALAHQQAKRDALDMYNQRVMQDVSGRENQMRDVDINGGWGKKLNDWQNFYQQNKQAILNPRRYGYDALNQFNAMHQDLLGEARQSTELNKQRLTMAQMMNEKLKKGDHIPDSDINELHQFDKSLYDPTRYIEENTVDKTTGLPFTSRRKPGMEYLSPNIPDLNEKQYFQTLTTGKKQLPTPVGAPEKILDDKGQWNWRMRQNYQMGYGDEDLKSMADKVRIDALQNRAVKKKAEEQFEQLSAFPDYQQQLNNTFKKFYNTDAQTPGDFYAASVLNQLGQKQQAQPKEYEDSKAKAEYTQNMISARQQRYLGNMNVANIPKEGENYDLTERLQGLKVKDLAGKTLGFQPDSKITYNPMSKQITYTDLTGNTRTKPIDQFRNDIETINTKQDLQVLDNVIKAIDSPQSKKINQPVKISDKWKSFKAH